MDYGQLSQARLDSNQKIQSKMESIMGKTEEVPFMAQI